MKFLSKYVAPWVLPNQVIPVHCVWIPEGNLEKIVVVIPDGYNLSDTLNFTKYDFDKSTHSILISAHDLKSNNYFGVVLVHDKIIEEIEKRDPVTLNFLDASDNVIEKLVLHTRIIRPKLELLSFPKEIAVDDKTDPKDLINLEILHRGFGTANLSINVIHSGIDISKLDSLFADVIRNLFERILSSADDEESKRIGDSDIDSEIIQKISEQILAGKAQNDLPIELDEKEKKELAEMLKDEAKKEMIYRIVYSSFRSLVLAALVYYGERHPEEDIKLLDGKIAADLTGKTDELTIRINYCDSIENEYSPLEAKIMVLDKRTFKDESEKLEVPINIVWKKDILDLGEQSQ